MTTPQPLLWKKLEGKEFNSVEKPEYLGAYDKQDVQTAVNECVEEFERILLLEKENKSNMTGDKLLMDVLERIFGRSG